MPAITNDLYRELILSSQTALCVTDTNRKIQLVNPAFTRLYGYERLLLDYSVLSDEGNEVAKDFGLAFEIPEEFREFHDGMVDLDAYNRDLSYLLPIPATYVVDRDETVRYAYINVDYTMRAEPAEVLSTLDEIAVP